jgi:hypothetical protein
VVDGLSQPEIEASDLENLLLAETKDHADWHLLQQLAQAADDAKAKQALQAVADTVESEEDEHLAWARDTLGQTSLQMVMQGPAPDPTRALAFTTGPVPPSTAVHPNPVDDDLLLPPAREPIWQDTPIVRAVRAAAATAGK